jgi:DNA replication and repair protein RecF
MYISVLELTNFRNYQRQSVQLCPFVNLIVGDNAQGKTNLLEAMYLSAVGRSARTPRDKEMILMGQDRAKVKIVIKNDFGTQRIETVIDKDKNKTVMIGGLPISRMGELMGVLQAVFFSPDELKLIKDAPSDRRRFMDIALSKISRSYFYLLSRYNRVLSQRNKLLKSGNASDSTLVPWDMQLADTGSLIIKTRRGFVHELAKIAMEEHSLLTEGSENLSLEYESIAGETVEQIKTAFLSSMQANRERECKLGYTLFGPHKDDIAIIINESDARKFGSQGQQRTAALSIKLAEVFLTKREKAEMPVLLLDDVMGELDKGRRKRLLERICDIQSVITCTHIDDELLSMLKEYRIINVSSGRAKVL